MENAQAHFNCGLNLGQHFSLAFFCIGVHRMKLYIFRLKNVQLYHLLQLYVLYVIYFMSFQQKQKFKTTIV